jgi:hypothetical protein
LMSGVLSEEVASRHMKTLIQLWMRDVGTKMWVDMTHFEIAGIMFSSSDYTEGDEVVCYSQGDAESWCSCADNYPEIIAGLWEREGGTTQDVWTSAVFP